MNKHTVDVWLCLKCPESEPWSSCTVVDVVHCTTAGATAPYVWHIQWTPYTATCSNHGVLGPWRWQLESPNSQESAKAPAAGRRELPSGHVHWQDSTSLFVSTFLSVPPCVSSLHHSDTLTLSITLSCSRLSRPFCPCLLSTSCLWFLSPTT